MVGVSATHFFLRLPFFFLTVTLWVPAGHTFFFFFAAVALGSPVPAEAEVVRPTSSPPINIADRTSATRFLMKAFLPSAGAPGSPQASRLTID